MKSRPVFRSLYLLTTALLPSLAFAYVGPGAGLSAIGTVLALVGAILLGIVGFVWYPIKRLIRGKQLAEMEEIEEDSDDIMSTREKTDSESHKS